MMVALFYVLNALCVPLIVYRGIYSPHIKLSANFRGLAFALLAFFDAYLTLWMDCRPRAIVYWALLISLSGSAIPRATFGPVFDALEKKRLALFLLSTATVSALVFLYLPISTFLTSPGELGLHLGYLTSENVSEAAAVVYFGALIYAFAYSPRAKSVLTLLALWGAFSALFYAYALPMGYPMMSGVTFEQIPIERTQLAARIVGDLICIVLTAIIVLKSLVRFGAKKLAVSLVVLHVSLIISTTLAVTRAEDAAPEEEAVAPEVEEKPLLFSRNAPNVLVIFLDRFMGGFIEEIFEKEPELTARLSGFTWYPKTVAAGQNSIAGVHPIFGGYDYTPKAMNARNQKLRDLSVEAYRILPLNFSRRGYQVNFVNPRGLGFTMAGDCAYLDDIPGVNCAHVSPTVSKSMAGFHSMPLNPLAESNYAALLVLLGAMRAAPYSLKQAIHERGPWKPFMDHSAGTTFREWAELKSLPKLTSTTSSSSNFNIMWSILPHEPYFMGEDCQPRRTRLELSDEEVEARGHTTLFEYQHALTARCALLLVADYLDWLKQESVYDNTRIVIVSDHGIVGNAEDHSSRAKEGGTTANIYVRSRSVLLIKKENDKGNLRVSEEFTPNAEVPRIVCEQIGGCVNPYLNDKTIEAHGRDDPFSVAIVPWQFNRQKENAFVIETEMTLKNGAPYDARAWEGLPEE